MVVTARPDADLVRRVAPVVRTRRAADLAAGTTIAVVTVVRGRL